MITRRQDTRTGFVSVRTRINYVPIHITDFSIVRITYTDPSRLIFYFHHDKLWVRVDSGDVLRRPSLYCFLRSTHRKTIEIILDIFESNVRNLTWRNFEVRSRVCRPYLVVGSQDDPRRINKKRRPNTAVDVAGMSWPNNAPEAAMLTDQIRWTPVPISGRVCWSTPHRLGGLRSRGCPLCVRL